MRFPELDGWDLHGRSMTLPSDLGSGPTLLLVRFEPQHSHEVETWVPLVTDLADSLPDFQCYDLLVLPEFPDDVQHSVTDALNTALADGVDVPTIRSLTAHTDVETFRRALVLDRPAQTYALLLHDGSVRWRAFGPLTIPLERSFRTAVTASSQPSNVNDFITS